MNKNKVKTITMWSLTGLLAVMFMLAGYSKFDVSAGWVERFVSWGYAPWFASVIGAAEIAGGIGLFIPKTSIFAAFGLVLIMLGAIATHLLNGEAGHIVTPLIYLAVLSAIIVLRRQKVMTQSSETRSTKPTASNLP